MVTSRHEFKNFIEKFDIFHENFNFLWILVYIWNQIVNFEAKLHKKWLNEFWTKWQLWPKNVITQILHSFWYFIFILADTDTFDLQWLQFKTLAHYPYLASESFKMLYLYHHKVGNKAMYGLFLPSSKKGLVFVLDTVRSNQMPNMNTMYNNERNGITLNDEARLKLIPDRYSRVFIFK